MNKKVLITLIALMFLLTVGSALAYNPIAGAIVHCTYEDIGNNAQCLEAFDGTKTSAGPFDSSWYYNGGADFWKSNRAWVHIDLGASYCIGAIEIIGPFDGGGTDYQRMTNHTILEYSTDNVTWLNYTGNNDFSAWTQNPNGFGLDFATKTNDNHTENLSIHTEARYWRYTHFSNQYEDASAQDGALGITEITFLESPGTCAAPSYSNINITNIFPQQNAQFNTQLLSLNASVNASSTFEAQLWINGTLNQTRYGFSSGKNIYVEFNLTFPSTTESTYNFFFAMNDSGGQQNTTNRTFHIDNVKPVDSISKGSINYSVSYGYNNIVGTINASDTNLWAINITIDGTTVIFNKTNLTNDNYNYNLSFNPKDYSLSYGHHTLDIFFADSHTATSIPDYAYDYGTFDNSIRYKFGRDHWIEISPKKDGLFSDLLTWKNNDRYVFNFQRDWTSRLLYGDQMQFLVKSSDKLYLIENSDYPGHIVSLPLQKWIDFDSEYKDAEVTTERLNEKEILVTVNGINADNVIFNSIGGLNIINKNYTFYYGNVTETYKSYTLETENTQFLLNFTTNTSYVSTISATLYYNNSAQTTTKTTGDGYIQFVSTVEIPRIDGDNSSNVSFYWNYTVYPTAVPNINNLTEQHNQTKWRLLINPCIGESIYEAINFSTINSSGDIINTTMEVYFYVYNSSSSDNRQYGFELTNDFDNQFCVLREGLTLNTNYIASFTATDYDQRDYIINNGRLSAIYQNISVVLSKSSDTTAITVNVVDENDNELVGYTVEAQLYSLSENNYTLIDSKETNSDGKVVFNLDVDSGQYLFYVKNTTGTTVYTEPKQTLTETTYTFRVILGTGIESILLKLQNLDYTLTADRDKNNFTLTWDDSVTNLIDSMNLTILKHNATSTNQIYSFLSTSDNSILWYNVSEIGYSYIAYAYAVSSDDGEQHLLDTTSIDIKAAYDIFGTDSLVMSLIFIVTMAFIGLTIGGETALILTCVGMILFFMMGFIEVALIGIINVIISLLLIAYRLKRK